MSDEVLIDLVLLPLVAVETGLIILGSAVMVLWSSKMNATITFNIVNQRGIVSGKYRRLNDGDVVQPHAIYRRRGSMDAWSDVPHGFVGRVAAGASDYIYAVLVEPLTPKKDDTIQLAEAYERYLVVEAGRVVFECVTFDEAEKRQASHGAPTVIGYVRISSIKEVVKQ